MQYENPYDTSGCYRFNVSSWVLLSRIWIVILTSLNVDSLIGSKLPKIESTCLTTIIGLEIYLEHRQLQ